MNANKQDAGGLLPCPFCATEECGVIDTSHGVWGACGKCGTCGPFTTCKEDALAAWNRRELCRAAPAGGDPERGKIDPSWSLFDRVDFALRDAGFDLDEAANIAALASGSAPAGSGEASRMDAVYNFLMGIADLDGVSFGELHPNKRGRFWWRHELAAAYALLRKLQQGADYVMVPRELTAENGAKAALTGEVQVRLRDGQPWVPVSWTAIKELHRKMVAHFDRAASQGQEGGHARD